MIRIILVDDDAFVLAGIQAMLAEQEDLEIVGTARDGNEAIDRVSETPADVVLMDLRMPGTSGIEATRVVKELNQSLRVLVLTAWDTDDLIRDALIAGADGFLLKDTNPQDLASAIRRTHQGEATLAPAVTSRLMTVFTHSALERQRSADALARLSDLEGEVAIAIADGLTNAEIATRQYMSVGNVKACVSRILTKLSLSNRVQIATLFQQGRRGDFPVA